MTVQAIQQVLREKTHPVTGAQGYDWLDVTVGNGVDLVDYAVKAFKNHWHVCSIDDEALTARFYKPAGRTRDWSDENEPAVASEHIAKIHSEIGTFRFNERHRQRREVFGELYMICQDCGGKLGSVDAMPGETEDRIVRCPKPKPNGKCGYDS